MARVVTLQSFIPTDQPAKLKLIADAPSSLTPVLTQSAASPASDVLRVNALKSLARLLPLASEDHPGPGAAESVRLAKALRQLAAADATTRDRAEQALALPLRLALADLQRALQAQPIDRQIAATRPGARLDHAGWPCPCHFESASAMRGQSRTRGCARPFHRHHSARRAYGSRRADFGAGLGRYYPRRLRPGRGLGFALDHGAALDHTASPY